MSTLEEIDSRAMKFNTSQASRAGGRALNFMDSGRIIFSFVWILALFTFETSVSVKEQLIVTCFSKVALNGAYKFGWQKKLIILRFKL